MDRKTSFTMAEIEAIKKLVNEKVIATSNKQKAIRDKIRKIGFHFSDFSSKKGYTIKDFEELISSGAIKILGEGIQRTFSTGNSNPIRQIALKAKDSELSKQHKKSLEPLVDGSIEILILGSMPGEYSLSVGEYYAHSGNRFWKIIAQITNSKIPKSYDEKRGLLKEYKIGLWDVADSAMRIGSLDSNMTGEIPNDINEFLKNHSKIKVVGLNGGKAVNLFNKFFNKQPNVIYYNLSSTSGANTSITFEESCRDWQRIFS
ncbi:DNA-deoxyinosine glycosylase [Mucilaginibacter terrigena]|uniref:DNA-deoxyinosine glycosylase n=1 Tax=Mucilaginibacter terrigena TaxID=2492395 RepID=A0A4Q5LNH0_9SPHI|nr:DNA-deoxyinosine glycosylase [Mucilaginibacter terrigena]RYU90359.1 DNA-deoxyinosine glycosylase [Mucilaginibacter terrigena]